MMAASLLLILQLAAGPVAGLLVDLPVAPSPNKVKLIPSGCSEDEGAEVVVCGRRRPDSRYRLEELDKEFEPKRLRAETGLGGGATARVHVQSVEMLAGQVSNRVMITLKLPF